MSLDAGFRPRHRTNVPGPAPETYITSVARAPGLLWTLTRDPAALAGAAFVLAVAAAAILVPSLLPQDHSRIDLARALLPPSPAHPFGTDALGRDVLLLAILGARVSLAIGAAAAAVSALLGVGLGLLAGYAGGALDAAISRLVEVFLSVPAFFILIAVQTVVGQGVANVVLLVSLVSWMGAARVVRALVLSLKEREFVSAARAVGCPASRILMRHILPNLSGQIAVLYALGVADALLMESALSFLGLGIPYHIPSWGNMLNAAQSGILSGAWWAALLPGFLILASALAVNTFGDGIQAAGLRESWPGIKPALIPSGAHGPARAREEPRTGSNTPRDWGLPGES